MLLFTSGSSGKPKGVVLSHRNIIGNVSQFGAMLDARKDDLILATLPFFHSFGCTVTLWYPLMEGVRVLTFPRPLETAKIATLIERYKATLILAAPTFSARLSAQSHTGTIAQCSARHHRRGKTAARSRGNFREKTAANMFSKATG